VVPQTMQKRQQNSIIVELSVNYSTPVSSWSSVTDLLFTYCLQNPISKISEKSQTMTEKFEWVRNH
jgi:hypothetical protein